jgi:DNA repair exonuclease SbcCD ATPase subunit
MLGLQREITTYVKSETIKSWVEFYRGVADDLTKAKNDINEELFTISKVLQEQHKYSSILEEEILPTMNSVASSKANYEAVADGLSPVNGLPCIYLIRFINRLIAKANKIIGKVWFYNLELMYLEEESDLDFNIKVMFRNSTEAKDISLLSNGQKAMVDLAMRLALCIERGFLEEFAVRLDEIDGPLTEEHRTKLVCMLSDLMDKGVIKQMLLVNHYAMQTGMHQCSCIALNTEGIVVPDDVNACAEIS